MTTILGISAVTFATHGMSRAVAFYTALGFELKYGGEDAAFTSFHCGEQFVNLIAESETKRWTWWGRAIFYVDDVDAFHARAVSRGLRPEAPPRDAPWGERYFHITDPDGHELSFAAPIGRAA